MKRPKANSNFFKTWSQNMAYILGFIVTDGCLVEYKNGYNGLNITNKNNDILRKILIAMESNHKISTKPRSRQSTLRYFQIQIRDKIIYSDLIKLGLTPRKSKTVRMPEVPVEFFADFMKGCFDGDGSVSVWQDPRWRNAWQIRAVLCSASLEFLRDVQKCLHTEFSLSKGIIQSLKAEYMLCYYIKDSVKLYDLMYGKTDLDSLFLKYKKDKFEFFKKVRPDCFDKYETKNMVGLYR